MEELSAWTLKWFQAHGPFMSIPTEDRYFIIISDFQKNEANSSIEIDSVHVTEQIAFHFCCVVHYEFNFLRHLFAPVLNMRKQICENDITMHSFLKNKCMK